MQLTTHWPDGTLAQVPVGSSATILALQASPAGTRRMKELGLRPGATVTVAQKTAGGGRVIQVATSRYALSATALRQVQVEV